MTKGPPIHVTSMRGDYELAIASIAPGESTPVGSLAVSRLAPGRVTQTRNARLRLDLTGNGPPTIRMLTDPSIWEELAADLPPHDEASVLTQCRRRDKPHIVRSLQRLNGPQAIGFEGTKVTLNADDFEAVAVLKESRGSVAGPPVVVIAWMGDDQ